MSNGKLLVVAVQGGLSLILLVGSFYLLATGQEVPDWLVGVVVVMVGSWFGTGYIVGQYREQNRYHSELRRFALLVDGEWVPKDELEV